MIKETTLQENRLYYVFLADDISEDAAKAEKKAILNHFHIQNDNGWLINRSYI